MREKDPNEVVFESIVDYIRRSKDSVWYKAIMFVYFDKEMRDDLTIKSDEYYEALKKMSEYGVIKANNYRTMVPFSKFCVYCADKLRNIKYMPMKDLNDGVILRFSNVDVMKKTAKKIDPERAFAKQKNDYMTKLILDRIKSPIDKKRGGRT